MFVPGVFDDKLLQGQCLALQALAPAQAQLEEPDPGASERPASIYCDDFTGVSLEVLLSLLSSPCAGVRSACGHACDALLAMCEMRLWCRVGCSCA